MKAEWGGRKVERGDRDGMGEQVKIRKVSGNYGINHL